MKKILTAVLLCMLLILAGCSSADKSELVDWLHDMNAEQTQVYFWAQPPSVNLSGETALTQEEEDTLLSILDGLTIEDVTWNKQQAGITPEYGFHLVIDGADYYINQAGAPHGQTEISFQGKQWWIDSAELFDFLTSFLEVS